VSSIMLIGTVGGIASLIRINYIKDLVNPGPDFLTNMLQLALWSAIEPGLGIIASCLATLRPLVRTFSQTFTSIKSRTRQTGNKSTGGLSKIVGSSRTGNVKSPTQERRHVQQNSLSDIGEDIEMKTNENVPDFGDSDKKFGSTRFSELPTTQKPTKESMGQRIKKASWWKPPTFRAGLMTEIGNAARAVEEEEENLTHRTELSKNDIEMGK